MHKNVLYSFIKVAASNVCIGNVNKTFFAGCQMLHPVCGDDVVCVFLLHFCCCNFSLFALCYSKTNEKYFLLKGTSSKAHNPFALFRCDPSVVVDNLSSIINGGDDYLLRLYLYSFVLILIYF